METRDQQAACLVRRRSLLTKDPTFLNGLPRTLYQWTVQEIVMQIIAFQITYIES
jgi:hypothetical protein